jgi:hypothetical protein
MHRFLWLPICDIDTGNLISWTTMQSNGHDITISLSHIEKNIIAKYYTQTIKDVVLNTVHEMFNMAVPYTDEEADELTHIIMKYLNTPPIHYLVSL